MFMSQKAIIFFRFVWYNLSEKHHTIFFTQAVYPPEAVLQCGMVRLEDWESSVIRPVWAAWARDEREPSWGWEGQQMVVCSGAESQAEPFRF